MRKILLWFMMSLWAGGAFAAENHAALFMYHRFGESNYPSTNIGLDQFQQQIDQLRGGKYQVWPLDKITAALQSDTPMPDYVVGLSIDDAASSVYREAWPRFKKANMPFTLFVTTDDIDRGTDAYMTWDQLRELHKSGLVTIGNHTKSHAHMPDLTPQQAAQEILSAQKRFQEELGMEPKLFAYPYGEFSGKVIKVVREFGFTAAFGQHSGIAHGDANFFTLPRFALNENYGQIERFTQAANALPLRVRDVTPQESVLDNPQPAIGFTVDDDIDAKNMSCFASDQGKVPLRFASAQRIEIRLPAPWQSGRARLNCTLQDGARWRWWGMQYIVK